VDLPEFVGPIGKGLFGGMKTLRQTTVDEVAKRYKISLLIPILGLHRKAQGIWFQELINKWESRWPSSIERFQHIWWHSPNIMYLVPWWIPVAPLHLGAETSVTQFRYNFSTTSSTLFTSGLSFDVLSSDQAPAASGHQGRSPSYCDYDESLTKQIHAEQIPYSSVKVFVERVSTKASWLRPRYVVNAVYHSYVMKYL
jgi:hypothetical protein